MNLAAKTCWN